MNLPSDENTGATGMPANLQRNPTLSQWVGIRRDGVVEIRPGKVDFGQGISTALAQIAAEELDVAIERIRVIPANTTDSPDENFTVGSLSIQDSGAALRYACAETRLIYVRAAAKDLGIPAESLSVSDGRIIGPAGLQTSYWALADERLLNREARAGVLSKKPEDYTLVGRSLARIDFPAKVFGRPCYVHDLELPTMVHGRILRPPSPGAKLESIMESRAKELPGVITVVVSGSFVGVLAEREDVAIKAAERLRVDSKWIEGESLPSRASLSSWLKSQPVDTQVTERHAAQDTAPVDSVVSASYFRPFLAHASIGPSCALAHWANNKLEVWCHSQGIYPLRADLALVFEIPRESIKVHHIEGSGCYGHNGADDVVLDAALLARAVAGRPVRVQWTREQELSWAPFGPAMTAKIEAGLDAEGNVISWCHTVWSNGHSSRPGLSPMPSLLAASHIENPFPKKIASDPPAAQGGGSERNAVPLYEFPSLHVVKHRVLEMPIRTSALRSLGAFLNIFSIESFLDELALLGGVDPVEFRLRYLKDSRAIAVVEAAVRLAGWKDWNRREGIGHGIAFARYKNKGAYCVVVAEVEAEHEILVRKLIITADVGLAINPDGVKNQLEGGAIQAMSWTLKEEVKFDRRSITNASWEDYPIVTFSELPSVDIELVNNRCDAPSLGAGEAAQGPTAAAIANAVYDALGIRVRDLPITFDRLIAAAN